MKQITVRSLTNQQLIADKCFVAVRFFDRLRGLIGTGSLEAGQGMLFPQCNDIHMWFMRIPIDVVFIRKVRARAGSPDQSVQWFVSSVHRNVQPWKVLPLRDGQASETLELPLGSIERASIRIGDELCIS